MGSLEFYTGKFASLQRIVLQSNFFILINVQLYHLIVHTCAMCMHAFSGSNVYTIEWRESEIL